jgi:hypothetical protein
VGQVKRAPAWNARREQTGLEILRRDWLIHDRMACNSGERSRDLVVAVRDGSDQHTSDKLEPVERASRVSS